MTDPFDRPRSLFRSRGRRGYLADVCEAGRHLTPGTVSVAEIWHDPDCRRPQGGPCTCRPEVKLRPFTDPESN